MTEQLENLLSRRLSSAAAQLGTEPAVAAEAALHFLDEYPGQPQALQLLVGAFRLCGELEAARNTLESIAEANPGLAAMQYELGLLLSALGLHEAAADRFSRVTALEPNHPNAWRVLANQRAAAGDRAGAADAFARHMKSSLRELKLLEDAGSGNEEEVAKAEKMLRQSLALNPTDIMTIRMLAQRELWLGRFGAARKLLEGALRLLPDLIELRHEYAGALQQELRWRDAIAQLDIILQSNPSDWICVSQKAWNLTMLGEYEQAFALFEQVQPFVQDRLAYWVNFGHALRTVGKQDEAVQAYHKVLELEPGYGLTWWSLAGLKTYRFSPAEIEKMREQLEREDQGEENRAHIEFALATALESEGEYAESFVHYGRANARRKPRANFRPDAMQEAISKAKTIFTPAFFGDRAGYGYQAPDPIFIVGLPRAGSTLIEQILSSHSAVEGTAELPDLPMIVAELKSLREGVRYPEVLLDMQPSDFVARGERYLASTRDQRKLARPFFTDKAPINFLHVGLIQVILPNAKIIDARRHPMACCFSGFKHCFQQGSMPHTYDLTDAGRYYREYVELMAYFDRVLPGRVYRVFHESMVRDTENEIRRLLDFCGLPFEESCLRFHETERGVRTFSSEQVRKPIYAPAVEPWKNFEEWLGPLKEALGDVLDRYPEVPAF